jgi:glycosyltransferase involved in cell wall biosynthesis
MTLAHFAATITVLTLMLAMGWLWQGLAAWRGVPTLADLTQFDFSLELPDVAASSEPEITVIVPACNEEKSIQKTLRSLLGSTGVRLQIVAVDDRSTDRTGALMDAIAVEAEAARGPHRLEVIHNRELPPGWLGKVHALSLGVERATAPWLLFTDGDVRFGPRAVELALRYAKAEKADHVVLLLVLEIESVAEAAVFATLQALTAWKNRFWKVGDPKAWDFFGAGGFNMVRREVYDKVGGFEALRMEVVEDLRLGWLIKRAGYAQRVVVGPGLVSIRWIHGALGLVGLLEKNGFAALRYRASLALRAFFGLAVQIALPLIAIALGGWATVAGFAVYASMTLTYAANRRVTQMSPWLAILSAPAAAVLMFALMRSTFLTLKRGGVQWRGTFYPLEELRRNTGREW